MNTEELLERHPGAWREAIRHPFLDAVRDGSLPAAAFETWLVQDYLFVADLLAFQARLLARAPRPAQAVLAGGLVAVEAELGWFEGHAKERGLDLGAPRHPTTEAYRRFMDGLEEEPYPVGIVALWALERAYLEAWTGAAPGQPRYREFVEHWTTAEFAAYVTALEEVADAALVSGDEEERAGTAFLEAVRLERDFWEMAWEEKGGGE
jgi:thiaminase